MEKINQLNVKKNIINDKNILRESCEKAKEESEKMYTSHRKYYADLSTWYHNIELFLDEIIMGKEEVDTDEFIEYLLNTELNDIQLENYFGLRFNPVYKRVLGMASLQKLYDLEEYISEREEKNLDFEISNEGESFDVYGKKVSAVKTIDEIGNDVTKLATKINYLKSKGIVSQEECSTLQKLLFDIYEYYSSISTGEQLSFNKISDKQYSDLEKDAKIRNISVEKRLREYLKEKKQNFELIQSLQEDYYDRNKELIKK